MVIVELEDLYGYAICALSYIQPQEDSEPTHTHTHTHTPHIEKHTRSKQHGCGAFYAMMYIVRGRSTALWQCKPTFFSYLACIYAFQEFRSRLHSGENFTVRSGQERKKSRDISLEQKKVFILEAFNCIHTSVIDEWYCPFADKRRNSAYLSWAFKEGGPKYLITRGRL